MNKAFVGLAIAVAVLAIVIAMRGGVAHRDVDGDPAATWSAAQKRHSPDVVLAISPRAAARKLPDAAPAARPSLSPAMQEFLSIQPLKPLFERLRTSNARTPEDDYLLAQILERCGRAAERARSAPGRESARAQFAASVSDRDPHRDRRIAAYDSFHRPRCEGIEVDTSDAELRALLEKAAAAGDAKARARLVEKDVWAPFRGPDGGPMIRGGPGAVSNPSISEAQVEALRDAVRSGDPEALLTAGRLFSSTMADLVIRAGPEGLPVDNRVFHDAWMLAACDQGLGCGPEHRTLLYGCAMQGHCEASDLRQYMFYYEHSPQQSQRLYEYQTQIQRALRGGDWSYFTFHRGPPAPGRSYHFFR